jgi:hypothetical protein
MLKRDTPNQSRDEILRILAENKSDPAKRFKVRRLALFGSFNRRRGGCCFTAGYQVKIPPGYGAAAH